MSKQTNLRAAYWVMERQQKLAAKTFAQSQQALQAQERQLQELLDYRQDYRQTLSHTGTSVRGQFIQHYQTFMERLDQGIAQQQQRITQMQHNCEKKRQEWLRMYHKMKAVENLQRRQALQEQRRQGRIEQKASDEDARRLKTKP